MPSKAKEQALRDIRQQLEEEKKEFIPFRTELDDTMRQLVRNHLRRQNKKNAPSSEGKGK